jgi:hypothetical protein
MLARVKTRRWSTDRAPRAALVGVVAVSLCATSLVAAGGASAAVPAFPDNVVVFPDRDFITVEGYQGHIGETATVEVTRGGQVVGSAQGVVAAGDVAFEINHPGGYCWGAGTGLKVTPDIQPGDVASIRFGAVSGGETRVQDAYVNGASTRDGNTVTVTGHLAGVDPLNFEQRIVEPALKDTSVARRDVRALPGPLTPADKGGYASGVTISGDTFTATYVFDEVKAAQLAADAAGARVLSWQETDVDGNRQGLTIAEYGELGGPGMGGCPNGPVQTGPPAPSNVIATEVAAGASIKLSWTPATAIPGTPAITSYRVTAVAQTVAGQEQVEVGRRIANPAATGTTITGLDPAETYDVEVRSVSSAGETFPVQPVAVTAVGVDTTAPGVTASPAGGSYSVAQTVTLTSEPGADIYYSLEGADLVGPGGTLSMAATPYRGPITVGTDTDLTYVAFDASGNYSAQGEQTYTITNDPVPAAPSFTGTPELGRRSVTLSWTAPDAGAPGLAITGYEVQVYETQGGPAVDSRTTAGDVTTLVVDRLTGDKPYFFTVRARNVNGAGALSAQLGPLTPTGPLVANAGADQSGVVRGSVVNLDGSASTRVAGTTYKWEQVELTGTGDPDLVTLTGATTRTPKFTYPLYAPPMTNKPLTFKLTVTSADGQAAEWDLVKVASQPDRVTIGTGRYRQGSELRVEGTGSFVGATVTVRSGSATGPVVGRVPVVAAVAPGIGDWSLRLKPGPSTNPGQVWVESNRGGTAGPFTLAR